MTGASRRAPNSRRWHGSNWIRPEKRQRLYARDGWRCLWCDRRAGATVKLSVDHFLAVQAGGSNRTDNLLTSCTTCNFRRQHRPALTFALEREGTLFEGAWRILDRVFEALSRPLPTVVP